MLKQQKLFASVIKKRYRGAFRFNEVVLDAVAWVRNLPRTIEALFFPVTAPAREIAELRALHKRWMAIYNQSGAPLLSLNLSRSTPFGLA
jgi:hypothetical protein